MLLRPTALRMRHWPYSQNLIGRSLMPIARLENLGLSAGVFH
jgi:hypothetical protein